MRLGLRLWKVFRVKEKKTSFAADSCTKVLTSSFYFSFNLSNKHRKLNRIDSLLHFRSLLFHHPLQIVCQIRTSNGQLEPEIITDLAITVDHSVRDPYILRRRRGGRKVNCVFKMVVTGLASWS